MLNEDILNHIIAGVLTEGKSKKAKKTIGTQEDLIKANRRASREEEKQAHNGISFKAQQVTKNKKKDYNRQDFKNDTRRMSESSEPVYDIIIESEDTEDKFHNLMESTLEEAYRIAGISHRQNSLLKENKSDKMFLSERNEMMRVARTLEKIAKYMF